MYYLLFIRETFVTLVCDHSLSANSSTITTTGDSQVQLLYVSIYNSSLLFYTGGVLCLLNHLIILCRDSHSLHAMLAPVDVVAAEEVLWELLDL